MDKQIAKYEYWKGYLVVQYFNLTSRSVESYREGTVESRSVLFHLLLGILKTLCRTCEVVVADGEKGGKKERKEIPV